MDFSILFTGFLITLFAGFISQLAGGGGAMITIPLLILLGVPPQVAIGSNKTSAFGNISSLYSYAKKKHVHWNWVIPLSAISLVAGWFGARFTLRTDPALIKHIISFLLLALLPLLLLKKTWGTEHLQKKRWKKSVGVFFYTVAAGMQAAFSTGLGIISTYILVTFFGWTLLNANGTRRIPVFVSTILVFVLFLLAGAVNWSLAIGIFFGQSLGSYFGAHVAIKKGNEFVKIFFVILVVASAVKLLL
ncbi:MAG: hypothetical protein COU32_02225 [Candidatus Magasanikbacteria bacterium CG10_big_fil_rev_8_21_14_0_10_42_10]|uniref:Probable membrane transporter protein n=1 Tax=Candidatus Magasanikbacteria bacterium CG10_big_fil_rev_8_21_14_0_10_42_10 TaxID=1974649 RepID=A0A2H0TW82_9BACT|nr:MAG: hypothetical protein COU32_02225 [Candidatus Magasanikbacteria bacterium CG10_big_fil_rev_8_21_14_0_10_42_10]